MSWTLNDALQECARNTYNTSTMVRTSSGYSGTGLTYARRFTSGINYAIAKISRERLAKTHTEEITLSERGLYFISELTYTCLKVVDVTHNNLEVPFNIRADERLEAKNYNQMAVSVTYEYLPDELDLTADLDTELPIDDRYVDPRIVCQYANYQFLSEEGTEYDSARADVWLGLFNDSFNNITPQVRMPRRVRYNG